MDSIRNARKNAFGALALAVGIALIAAPAAHAAQTDRYVQHNLVSDEAGVADHQDPDLVNAWGIAFNPFGPVWVNSAERGFSKVYNGAGTLALTVAIPPAAGGTESNPTGIVFNANPNAFLIPTPTPADPNAMAAARFLFVTENGVLAGWNSGNTAKVIKDNSGGNKIYKGLAIGAGGNGALLYATDFHNNYIDVWDASFNPVNTTGIFVDPQVPWGFAPFGIQNINGNIYVTYAMRDENSEDDVPGKGNGYVAVFDPNGTLLDHLIAKGQLNSPWGLALAPAGFGKFGNRLLVGNFGDGTINAYDLFDGNFVGELRDADNKTLVIEGLWGIAPGNGYSGQPVNSLFFTAGPHGEEGGLYGRLNPAGDD